MSDDEADHCFAAMPVEFRPRFAARHRQSHR
jgi:hypothetical protein